MKKIIKTALYSIMLTYVLIVLAIFFLYVINILKQGAPFSYFFHIIFFLISTMIFLGFDYFKKNEKNKEDKVLFLLYLFFIPSLFPLISVLIFGIFNDDIFSALEVFIPIGIISAIIFLIVNYFIEKKNNTNKRKLITIKLLILFPILVVSTIIYLIVEYGEIIKPLKKILEIN